jgi:polysaccharide biosynthesis protein PslF
MKLLVVSAAYPPRPCGEATNTYFLCRHLAGLPGTEVHVLTNREGSRTVVPGITIHDEMRDWSWKGLPHFVARVRDLAPDSILLMYIGSMYGFHPMITFAPSIVRRILPSAYFVSRIEYPIGSLPHKMPLLSRACRRLIHGWVGSANVDWLYGTLLRDSDQIISLCDDHRSQLQRRYAGIEGKTTIIPPPSNVPVVEDKDGGLRAAGRKMIAAGSGDFVVGYMGYLYPSKGVETLLHAFQCLRQKRKDVRLLIAGGAGGATPNQGTEYYEKVRNLSRALGVDDWVTWTGGFSVADGTFPSYVHAVDAWVLPFDDGVHFNNSSFASLASYGVPLVVTQGAVAEKAFVDRQNVLLCGPKNPAALSATIDQLISDGELRCKLRIGIRCLAKEWLGWEKAVNRTLALLKRPARDGGTQSRHPLQV